jgi:hypothetical protein
VNHECTESGRTSVSYREGSGVDETLDEGSLKLGEEGFDELRYSGEEDRKSRENSGFDGSWEAVSDNTNCDDETRVSIL